MDENFVITAEKNVKAEILAGIERARVRTTKPTNFAGTCECGNEVPAQRVALGYYRCIGCQSSIEKGGAPDNDQENFMTSKARLGGLLFR